VPRAEEAFIRSTTDFERRELYEKKKGIFYRLLWEGTRRAAGEGMQGREALLEALD